MNPAILASVRASMYAVIAIVVSSCGEDRSSILAEHEKVIAKLAEEKSNALAENERLRVKLAQSEESNAGLAQRLQNTELAYQKQQFEINRLQTEFRKASDAEAASFEKCQNLLKVGNNASALPALERHLQEFPKGSTAQACVELIKRLREQIIGDGISKIQQGLLSFEEWEALLKGKSIEQIEALLGRANSSRPVMDEGAVVGRVDIYPNASFGKTLEILYLGRLDPILLTPKPKAFWNSLFKGKHHSYVRQILGPPDADDRDVVYLVYVGRTSDAAKMTCYFISGIFERIMP